MFIKANYNRLSFISSVSEASAAVGPVVPRLLKDQFEGRTLWEQDRLCFELQ